MEVGHRYVFSVCEGPLLVALLAAMSISRYPISLDLHWPRASDWFSYIVGFHGEEAMEIVSCVCAAEEFSEQISPGDPGLCSDKGKSFGKPKPRLNLA